MIVDAPADNISARHAVLNNLVFLNINVVFVELINCYFFFFCAKLCILHEKEVRFCYTYFPFCIIGTKNITKSRKMQTNFHKKYKKNDFLLVIKEKILPLHPIRLKECNYKLNNTIDGKETSSW